MLSQEHRRVNNTGPAGKSLVMRLPVAWAREVGIGAGAEVLVAFGIGEMLIVAPSGKERQIARLAQAWEAAAE